MQARNCLTPLAIVAALTAPVVLGQPTTSRSMAAPRIDVQEYLSNGKLETAEGKLTDALKSDPSDDQTRLGLGLVQMVRGVERLMQGLHRYGLRTQAGGGMLAMATGGMPPLPIPPNPSPDEISYDQFRGLIQTWVSDLATVDATLGKLSNADVKLDVQIGLVRMDFDGDGQAGEEESLWRVYQRLNREADISLDDVKKVVIGFDRADAEWLRGYCNLLMALGDFFLAYDEHELFERTGQLIFPRVKTPHAFLKSGGGRGEFGEFRDIVDLISFVHLINFPVKEPARLKSALEHLQAMTAHSRTMWKLILAETDDDHEWIPSPRQTGIIPDMKITTEMIQGWMDFLDEADALLAGKKLIPFWRGDDPQRGVNLHKFFTEPQPFDLVLWVQGTAATPFLEQGTLTSGETWERFDRIFQGQFVGIAFWLN